MLGNRLQISHSTRQNSGNDEFCYMTPHHLKSSSYAKNTKSIRVQETIFWQ